MNNKEYQQIKNSVLKHLSGNFSREQARDLIVSIADRLGAMHMLMPDALLPYGPALPDKAPELYQAREDRSEMAPEFIRRVYGQWMGHGLMRNHLLELDKPLYMALAQWLQKHDMPDWLDLPTKKQLNDRQLVQLGLAPDSTEAEEYLRRLKELYRLKNAAQNRR